MILNQTEREMTSFFISFSVLDFAAQWIKYKYGVFDEFGTQDDARFPKYYSKGDAYYLNSCSDAPVIGDFNESCAKSANCPVNVGQDQVLSSILFSRDRSLFPRVSF